MAETPITVVVDCHGYPWHVEDPDFPECGPGNLDRMALRYGVTVRFLPDHEYAGWGWMYSLTGRRVDIIDLLFDEYTGGCDRELCEEMCDDG